MPTPLEMVSIMMFVAVLVESRFSRIQVLLRLEGFKGTSCSIGEPGLSGRAEMSWGSASSKRAADSPGVKRIFGYLNGR
jgi:hypothetical protein